MFKSKLKDYQVTPESIFWNRRDFIKKLGLTAASAPLSSLAFAESKPDYSGSELNSELSSEYVITHHNNFYEFSTDKKKPSKLAESFKPGNDWKVKVEGHVNKPR